uniref:Integrase core domain-containing protein n=1 Tax=Hucho hucho TaxID=62062 RepID=A0A4W5MCW4_9TELE
MTIRQMADVLNVLHSVVKWCMRWRIVIHGAVDGYSRLVFLKASDNNRSATVMESFEAAITSYGVPSRVRCDRGGENNRICAFMEQFRGCERGSAFRERSTRNQRIDRLWGDVWHGDSNVYHDLFTFLETEQIIDINNEVHLWALRFVFLPQVNKDLAVFAGQWNHHGLRTEQRQSPLQLFVSGFLAMQRARLTEVKDLFSPNSTTICSQATTSAPPTTAAAALYWSEGVIVPQIQFTISNTQMELLQAIIPLEGPKGSLGVDILQRVMAVISSAPLIPLNQLIFIILTFPLFHTVYDLVSRKVRQTSSNLKGCGPEFRHRCP